MPIHPDWQELYRSFVEQYGKEKGEAVFYAYCKKHSIDYTKPRPKRESFSWVGDLKPEGTGLIRGKALHPIKTMHPEEWPSVRVYLEEELKKSAQTLAGKPLLLDHGRYINGEILSAAYEDGAIEYLARVDDPQVLDAIGRGEIKHCSVEYEWQSLDRVDGVAPRGINFVGLSLLSQKLEPGDPLSSVELWEAIIQRLKETKDHKTGKPMVEQAEPQEFIYYRIREPEAFLPDRFSTLWVDRINGVQGIYGRLRDASENPQPMALLFMRANGWDMARMEAWLKEHPQYVRGLGTEPQAVGVQPAQAVVQPKLVVGIEKAVEEAKNIKILEDQVKILRDQNEALKTELREARAKRPMGEAVVEPHAESPIKSGDFVSRTEVLKLLPERIPQYWGYGPYQLVQRIRRKLEA